MYSYAENSASLAKKAPKVPPPKPQPFLRREHHHVDHRKPSVEESDYAEPTPCSSTTQNGAVSSSGSYSKPPAVPSKPSRPRPPPPGSATSKQRDLTLVGEYDEPHTDSLCYDKPSTLAPAPPKHAVQRQISDENHYNPPYSVSTLNRKEKTDELLHYQQGPVKTLPTASHTGKSVFYDFASDDPSGVAARSPSNSSARSTDNGQESTEELYDEPYSDGNAAESIYYSEAVEPSAVTATFQLRRMQNKVGQSDGNGGSLSPRSQKKYRTLPKAQRPPPLENRARAFTHNNTSPEMEMKNDDHRHTAAGGGCPIPRPTERPPLPLPKKTDTVGEPTTTKAHPRHAPHAAHPLFESQEPAVHSKAESKPRFNKKFSFMRPKVGNTNSNLNKDVSVSMPALNFGGSAAQEGDKRKPHEHSDGLRGKLSALMRPRRIGKTVSDADADRLKQQHRQSAPVIDGRDAHLIAAVSKGNTLAGQQPLFLASNGQKSSSPKMDRDLQRKLAFQKQRAEKQGALIEEDAGKQVRASADDTPSDMPLFESVLVVTLKDENSKLVPYISFQFPPKASEPIDRNDRLQAIPSFCFPDLDNEGSSSRLSIGYGSSETFSFVLTDMDGNRHFGYCRHVLDDSFGSATKALPKVFCIISSLGLFSLYSQLLDEVERQQLNSPATVFSLLKTVLSQPLPLPGETLTLPFYSSGASGMETITLKRPGDSAIHAHVDLRILFETLSVSMILSVVTSLLMEKRVILCSSSLSVLSACCHGCISLLYPFVWQHTYIPVLPRKLVDICCSPTPYLLGVLSVCVPEMEDLPTAEVIIVDLDEGNYTDEGDSENFFPKSIRDEMDKTLNTVNRESKKRDSFVYKEHRAKNQLITEVFVQAYLQMIGCFEDHIVRNSDGSKTFQENSFGKATNSKEVKKFRKNFIKTQAFLLFISPWLSDEPLGSETGLFEQRLEEWKLSRKMDFHSFAARVRELLPKSKTGPQEGGGFHRFLGKLTAK